MRRSAGLLHDVSIDGFGHSVTLDDHRAGDPRGDLPLTGDAAGGNE